MQKIINQFNQPDTHLVISRWPGKKKDARFDGIATYTKETVTSFVREYNTRFVILAEVADAEPKSELIDEKILLLRIFDPTARSLFPKILEWLKIFDSISEVFVHAEFCASSAPKIAILEVPFLLLIRLSGRRITYYAHNVVDDLTHLNLNASPIKIKLLTWGLRAYYVAMGMVVNRFVVLEEVIKTRLKKYVKGKPIAVQLHWVRQRPTAISARQAKKRLGLNPTQTLIMSFGYVSYYKGSDWLAELAEKLSQSKEFKNLHFVLAGGPIHSLKFKRYSQSPAAKLYYNRIQEKAAKLPNLTLTGFIPEDELPLWFAAADLVICPYRGLIGGSGALTLAISHNKLFLVSREMLENLQSQKLEAAIREAGLKQKHVCFSLNSRSFVSLLQGLNNKEYREKLTKYCNAVSDSWSYERLVHEHYNQIYINRPAGWKLASVADEIILGMHEMALGLVKLIASTLLLPPGLVSLPSSSNQKNVWADTSNNQKQLDKNLVSLLIRRAIHAIPFWLFIQK